jgi:hypothetical protein
MDSLKQLKPLRYTQVLEKLLAKKEKKAAAASTSNPQGTAV